MENLLTNRELLILSYLERYEVGTAKDLAEFLGVSERTIKNDIHSIKDHLNPSEFEIKSIPGIGYQYINHTTLKNNQYEYLFRDKDLILHNYDRISFIIQAFLANEEFIKYEDLAESLYISRSTLQKDMIKVRELFSSFRIEFLQKPNYGVKIIGKESDIRAAILFFIYNSFWGLLGQSKRPEIFQINKEVFETIVKIIKDNLSGQVNLNDNMTDNLAYMIYISFVRQKNEKDLYNIGSSKKEICCITEQILLSISDLLSRSKGNKYTLNYIANYISGYEIRSEFEEDESIIIKKLLNKIISEIYRNFDLDFSGNHMLLSYLALHIEQVIRRVKRETPLYNALVMSYFRDYVFATKITISVINILEVFLGEVISIDEYGDFILYFQIALENSIKEKVKIGIFTGSNLAEGALIFNTISSIINNQKYELNYLDDVRNLNDYDIILSSRNISEDTGKANVINTVFDKDSLASISNSLNNYYIEDNSLRLRRYIHAQSILRIRNDQKDQVMSGIIEYLRLNDYLKPETNKNLVFHEFGNRIVHIQDLHKIIRKEICLFVILENPIIWDKIVVENLLLIKTKKDGDVDLPYLCELFSNFINNPEAISRVREGVDYNMFMNILIEASKKY